jgi:hypothetical protein
MYNGYMKTLLSIIVSLLVSISAVASQTYSCTHSVIENKGYLVTVDQQQIKRIQAFTKNEDQNIRLGFDWIITNSQWFASGGGLINFEAQHKYYSADSFMRGTLEIEDPTTMLHLEAWSEENPVVETFSGSCLKTQQK